MRVDAYSKPANVYYHVWLDGKCVTHVFAADDVQGWIVCNLLDCNDRIVMESFDTPLELRLYGRVTIINPMLLPVPLIETYFGTVIKAAFRRACLHVICDACGIPRDHPSVLRLYDFR